MLPNLQQRLIRHLTAFLGVFFVAATGFPQEPGSMTQEQMFHELERISQLFRGWYVRVQLDGSDGKWPQEYWCDADGYHGQAEWTYGYQGKDWKGTLWTIRYSNGKYLMNVTQRPPLSKTSPPADVVVNFGNIPCIRSTAAPVVSIGNGWCPGCNRRTIELLLANRGRWETRKTTYANGERLESLIVPNEYGLLSFGFRDRRVRFVEVTMPNRTRYPASLPTPDEPFDKIDLYPQYRAIYSSLGPFEFNAAGELVAYQTSSRDGALIKQDGTFHYFTDQEYTATYRVSARPLRPGELTKDGPQIDKFRLSRRIPVAVPRHSAPHDLVNGQLVPRKESWRNKWDRLYYYRWRPIWKRWRNWGSSTAALLFVIGLVVARQLHRHIKIRLANIAKDEHDANAG